MKIYNELPVDSQRFGHESFNKCIESKVQDIYGTVPSTKFFK